MANKKVKKRRYENNLLLKGLILFLILSFYPLPRLTSVYYISRTCSYSLLKRKINALLSGLPLYIGSTFRLGE
jgi:hypothetical protein